MSALHLEDWDVYMQDGTLRDLYDSSSRYLEGEAYDISTYNWHIYQKQIDFGYEYEVDDPDENGKRQYILQNWRGVLLADNGWMAIIKEDDYPIGIEGGWLNIDIHDNKLEGNLIRCYGLYRDNKQGTRSWIYDPDFLSTRRPFVNSLGAKQVMWVFQKNSPILNIIDSINSIGSENNVEGFTDDTEIYWEDTIKKYEVLEGTTAHTEVEEEYTVCVAKVLK